MTPSRLHPLEAMLRMCAAAAPGAWYPKAYAETENVKVETLYEWLELLFLEKLVEKAPGTKETGPGVSITEEGKEILKDEEALERLRSGRALRHNDRGGLVREMLLRPNRPLICRLLFLVNALWFGYDLWLAWGMKAVTSFVMGDANSIEVRKIIMESGGLGRPEWIHGDWWRLLTAAFVHGGILHFGINMLWLFSAGTLAERVWGRLSFLLIYLFSAIGCSAFMLAYSNADAITLGALAEGASGALCGMIAAELVWIGLNGRYLPHEMLRKWRWQLLTNALIMAAVGYFFRGVGVWGYIGGATAGVVCGLLLTFYRFALFPFGVLAVPLLALMPVVGWYLVERSREGQEVWKKAEEEEFRIYYSDPIKKKLGTLDDQCANARDVKSRAGANRSKMELIRAALNDMTEGKRQIGDLDALLQKAGPYRQEATQERVRKLADSIRSLGERIGDTEAGLSEWIEKEKQQRGREEEFEQKHLQSLARNCRGTSKYLCDVVEPLLAKSVANRKPAEVAAVRENLKDRATTLGEQETLFLKMGHYWEPSIEEARQRGYDYFRDATTYCKLADKALALGDAWQAADNKELSNLKKRLDDEAKGIEEMFEK